MPLFHHARHPVESHPECEGLTVYRRTLIVPAMLTTVIDILTRNAGLPPEPVTPDATLVGAGVDSMAIASWR
ncbi:acyl carrier protein [Streptomyces sp. NPDC060334]|uniref:acyl carrier protein n=1 Tax=unclassified Streptomyces TaxID=2593676 RepID=UPI0036521780